MEIKIGKYILKSDKFSMYLLEEYKAEDGKIATKQVAGFCTSLESLLNDFIDKRFKDNDAKSVEEVIKILDKASKDAKKIGREAAKGNFRIVRNKEK